MMKYTKYTKYIMYTLIALMLISSVVALTLLKSRQIDTEWKQYNVTNISFLQVDNASVTFLNASIIMIDGILFEPLSDPFMLENYSDEYGKTGYNETNFTEDVAAYDQFYKTGNYSVEYGLTGWNKTNITIAYPLLDTVNTDDFSFTRNMSSVPVKVTFTKLVTFLGDVLFFGNISIANSTGINGSIVPFINNTFDLGNGTNYWRDIYIGRDVLVKGNKVQTQEAIWNEVNDSANYNVLNVSSALWNLSPLGIGQRDVDLNVNISGQFHVDRNLTIAGAINSTHNGTIRFFFNGCSELVNESGIHIIC